jgi:hypothetical protein
MTADETRAELLTRLLILGPEPLDILRDQLIAELGGDVALPAMRIIRPIVEELETRHRAARRELRDACLRALRRQSHPAQDRPQ